MFFSVFSTVYAELPITYVHDSEQAVGDYVSDPDLAHYAYILGLIDSDTYLTCMDKQFDNSIWMGVLRAKRLMEIDGIDTSSRDDEVKAALENYPMLHYLPLTIEGTFYVYYRWMIECYRYAESFGLDSKWNLTGAYEDCKNALTGGGTRCKPFLYTNPVTNSTGGGDRWYDENAECLSLFLGFESYGIEDAKQYVDQIWYIICSTHWTSRYGGFYTYRKATGTDMDASECCVSFHTIMAEYAYTRDFNFDYFANWIHYNYTLMIDRSVRDLNYKFLGSGWDSVMWQNYSCIHAYGLNGEHRLSATLQSYFVIDSYYPLLTSAMRNTYASMLLGNNTYYPAFEGFLTESELYDNVTKKFVMNGRIGSVIPETGFATLMGCLLGVMANIVPMTGYLALPQNEEMYIDTASIFPATHFGFYCSEHELKIPVFAGEIGFTFNGNLTYVIFPCDGIYMVYFDNDWNAVNCSKIGDLEGYSYVKSVVPIAPEYILSTELALMLVASALSLVLTKKKRQQKNKIFKGTSLH